MSNDAESDGEWEKENDHRSYPKYWTHTGTGMEVGVGTFATRSPPHDDWYVLKTPSEDRPNDGVDGKHAYSAYAMNTDGDLYTIVAHVESHEALQAAKDWLADHPDGQLDVTDAERMNNAEQGDSD